MSAYGRLAGLSAFRKFSTSSWLGMARRPAIYKLSGAIRSKPKKTSFGLIRIIMVVVPFLYVGKIISESFAKMLEEHDIFIPEVEDDDD